MREAQKETRWIINNKPPVSSTHTNSDKVLKTDAVPNQTDVVSNDKNVNLPAEKAAASSTNLVPSKPIPFQIYPVPPGTKHDYEQMTRDAARARAEVSRSRIR